MGKRFSNSPIYSCAAMVALTLMLAGTAWACPFCDTTQQTLSEEFAASDASVIAVLEAPVKPAAESNSDAENDPFEDGESGPYKGATFKIVEVLRGDLKPGDVIEAVYFGEEDKDKHFLINGIQGDQLDWGSPLPLTEKAVDYVKHLPNVPKDGSERLAFFMNYLENADPLLAQDAYDEFARAPYQDLIDLKALLHREQLVEWILDSQIGPTRRRLYLTMLGVCGTSDDVAMLEGLLKYNFESIQPALATLIGTMGATGSAIGVPLVDELVHADVRAKQQCLDALIAAYLKLKGPDGLTLIEERFLKNPKADYTQLYSTIMALRFHGEESSEIPKDRLVHSLRLLLDNDEIADQVIPDLTRWEDWGVMDQLVEKFKASEKDGWIRQPVISYLLTAAEQGGDVGEKANTAVAELEKIDPDGVKRARNYLAWGLMPGTGTAATANAQATTSPDTETQAAQSAAEKPSGSRAERAAAAKKEASAEAPSASGTAKQKLTNGSPILAAPSRTTIIVIPTLIGLALMGVYSLMLRGGHTSPPRAPGN
jgi:hypothetical protein